MDTDDLDIDGHQAAYVLMDTDDLDMDGHQVAYVLMDTDDLDMDGHQAAYVLMDTDDLDMDGHQPAYVLMDTDELVKCPRFGFHVKQGRAHSFLIKCRSLSCRWSRSFFSSNEVR